MCSPFLSVFVLSFFLFLFFDVVVRLHTDTIQTVCTRKINIITRDLYFYDDVAGWLVDCQVLKISKSKRKESSIEYSIDVW
jgi:hypothetical protein